MLDSAKLTQSVTFNAADLRRAVTIAAQVVERRNTIAILGMLRITADRNAAVVRATNLDIEIFADCAVMEASGKIDITIEPRLLSSLLRWADGEVRITTEGSLISIQIDDVEAKVRQLCDAGSDWPAMIGPQSEREWLSEAVLQKAIDACLSCISKEETRYYLNGIYFHGVEGKLCLVATDGHRLSKYQTDAAWPFGGQIVHTATIQLLHRLSRKNGNSAIAVMCAPDMTNVAPDSLAPKQPSNRVEFRGDGWRMISKTIDGTYPDYTRVIPAAEATITATITHQALRRFGETNERARCVAIDPAKGRMSYSMPDGPTISMPVQAKGDVTIGFNLSYLRAFTAKAGTIRLETSGKGDPARVLSADPALLQIIMPMRV